MVKKVKFKKGHFFHTGISSASRLICSVQKKSGEIPWYQGGKTDPWDHIESAMGLAIGGYLGKASRAFEWLRGLQMNDGSWYSSYRDGVPEDKTRETNMIAYIAVGVFQYWLITNDYKFLKSMKDMVWKAIDFVVDFQGSNGEIYWAISPKGDVDTKALLTASSSIFMSLKCAVAIARELGIKKKRWENALKRLKMAILYKKYLFDSSKSRFSMDWFYPVLCGIVLDEAATIRMQKFWGKFVVDSLGVRCVSDRPWITIAETSELVLSLAAMGEKNLAMIVFDWILGRVFKDGSFWCGFTFPEIKCWPEEKFSWTNAVVLMAADALFGLTPAKDIFSHVWWKKEYCL